MTNEFTGKKVLVAGGTGGIGKAIAEAFLVGGARVFVQGRNLQKLEKLISELDVKYKGNISGTSSNLLIAEDFSKLLDAANNFLDGIDVLVSAIGSGKFKKTGLLTQEEWSQVMDQNFYSTALLLNTAAPFLEKGLDSNVVVMGSIAGIERLNAPVGYTVAKAALHAYVRAMSEELASRKIRVNIIHPGNIYFEGGRWEEIQDEDPAGTKNYIESVVPQRRFGSPEDVAQAVLALASPKSSFITGASLEVDGGQSVSF